MTADRRAKTKRRHRAPAPGDGIADLLDTLRKIFAPVEPQQIMVYKEIAIPEDMFRKLIMLCHPDKHGNSKLSQEVTRWLLDQRKEHE